MAGNTLENLLKRIRDGLATPADLSRARELLANDARFPVDLRQALDDEPGVAAGALLALLGVDDGFASQLAGAIHAEAGTLDAVASDVAQDVVRVTHPDAPATPVAEAVHTMAGGIDITHEVLDQLALELADVPLAEAVHAFAGRTDVVDEVLAATGLSTARLPVADAVRAHGGRVEVAAAVVTELALDDATLPIALAVAARAGTVDVAPAVMQAVDSVARAEELLAGPAWVSAVLDNQLSPELRQAATERLRGNKEALAEMTAFAEMGRQIRSEVASEAGDVPYLWDAVAREIGLADPEHVPGWDGAEFAAAIREHAGTVDVVDGVMGRVLADRIRTAAPVHAIPDPANRPWAPVLALAAAALFAIAVVGPGLPGGNAPAPATSSGTTEVAFAQSDEIIINELEYAETATVQVIQADGENAPLIIWVDEGTTL